MSALKYPCVGLDNLLVERYQTKARSWAISSMPNGYVDRREII
jgi:hypothetical protein